MATKPESATSEQISAPDNALEGTMIGFLQSGIERHQAGDLGAAEDSYGKVLEIETNHPHALHLLGVVHHQRGDHDTAIEMIERAVALNPSFGDAYSNLGAAYFAAGNVRKAEINFRRATELNPNSAEAHSNLAAALNDLGNSKDAIKEFEAAHRANPSEPRFVKRLGDLYLELDLHREAVERFELFLAREPDNAEVQSNLGYAYERLLDLEKAIVHYVRACELSPETPEILNNAASVLNRLNRPDEAEAYFARALAIAPDGWDNLANLAGTYANRNEFERALPIYRQLVEANPDDPKIHSDYAIAIAMSGRTLEAIGWFEKAIELDPEFAEAYNNIGCNRVSIPDHAAAIEAFKKAIEIQPRYVAAHVNLAQALMHQRLYDEAYFWARATLLLENFHPKMFTNPNKVFRSVCDFDSIDEFGDLFDNLEQNPVSSFTAAFLEMLVLADSPEKIERMAGYHRQWGDDLSRRLNAKPLAPLEPRKIGAKIRLGFMSSDLRIHSVAKFVLPLFQTIDRTRFELYCYTPYEEHGDSVQEQFKEVVDSFQVTQGWSDHQTAQKIRDDAVDILFEMNGFTRDSRMKVMTLKPAPIQIEWLGYPFTTGVAEIDYLLLDPDTQPENPEWLVEEPLLMPHSWVAFGELDPEPISEKTPFERNGRLTFGTMNNPYKYTPEMIATWAEIMCAVPESRFLVVRPECGSMAFCTNYAKAMERNGISADRLNFVNNRMLSLPHLSFYDEMDISLDTFPVTGGNTTCDSLWMGVPVVSLCGPSLHQRVSASILNKVGLSELVTATREDYVKIAIELAGDRETCEFLRVNLRPQLQNSCLGDTEGWARDFESLMEELVRKHDLV